MKTSNFIAPFLSHSLMIGTLTIAIILPHPSDAEDFGRGQELFEHQCHGCHGDIGMSKKTNRSKNMEELRKKIASWAEHGGSEWGNSEIDDVLLYLNKSFYHFKADEF